MLPHDHCSALAFHTGAPMTTTELMDGDSAHEPHRYWRMHIGRNKMFLPLTVTETLLQGWGEDGENQACSLGDKFEEPAAGGRSVCSRSAVCWTDP